MVSGAERNGPAGEEENKPCPGSKKQTEEMDGKHRENQERYVYLSGIDSRLQKTFQIHYFEAAAVSPSQEEVCKPHGNLRKEEYRKGKSAQRTFLFSVCSVCFLSKVFQYPYNMREDQDLENKLRAFALSPHNLLVVKRGRLVTHYHSLRSGRHVKSRDEKRPRRRRKAILAARKTPRSLVSWPAKRKEISILAFPRLSTGWNNK